MAESTKKNILTYAGLKELEAEFKSTPTVLTQFSTTPPKTSFKRF